MINYEKFNKNELIGIINSLHSTKTVTENEQELLVHDLKVHQIELELQNRELQETQNKLEETNCLYADLYDFAPVGYISLDENGIILEINITAATMLGKERSRLINRAFSAYVVPNDLPKFRDHLWKCRHTNDKATTEISINTSENQLIQIQLSSIAVHDSKRNISLYRTTLADITELKQAKEVLQKNRDELEIGIKERTSELTKTNAALAAEKEQLSVTLFSIGDAVITTDIEGKIVLLNRVAENLTGWAHEAACGRSITEVFRVINDKTGEPLEYLVANPRPDETTNQETELAFISKDGSKNCIDFRIAPILDSQNIEIGSVLVFHDITNQRKLEKEALKIQKLESLGFLAAGIAHDFNNFLAGILASTQLSELKLIKGIDITLNLKNIGKTIAKAAGLTKQLLTFAKGGEPVKEVVSLSGLIKDAISFALQGSNVQSELIIPADLWLAEIDEGQIGQVINNLIINACQAMPEGGVIKVSLENIKINAMLDKQHFQPGNYVLITIADQGIGIPEENLPYIFDPYFTTKQTGSGLGLATSYSIINKHHGYLEVESSLGIGTTFSIYLPASFEVPLEPSEKKALILAGTGKILLMDDEAIIRNCTGEMLSQLGYKVHLAADGTEAIKLYTEAQQSGIPFDVVIMDLTIPGGMGGKDTIKKLIAIDPQVKAIVSSGYSNDPIISDYRHYGFGDMITKPYGIEELHAKLSGIINDQNNIKKEP